MTQDVRREDKDRPDLGICDYIDPSSPIPPTPTVPDETTDLTAVISGNKNLRNSYNRTYTINFTDKDGNIVDWQGVDYKWNIVADFDIKQTIKDSQITLFVNDENLIGDSFLLQVIINSVVVTELKINIAE